MSEKALIKFAFSNSFWMTDTINNGTISKKIG